jgi:PAS domain S-box-containing protein
MTRAPDEPGSPADDAGDRRHAALTVGLGASAGGLDALERFFDAFHGPSGLTYVVVQHLEPHHPSMLVDLLARHTAMQVVEAVDGLHPEREHVYVIAPGTLLTLERGRFTVSGTPDTSSRAPIDTFFRSLAEECGDRAVGIVFSGAGHDGTAGLRAVKERGGLTLAQTPATARHEGMPQSAIDAGLADHVLRPEQMAKTLLEHAGYVSAADRTGAPTLDSELAEHLLTICAAIRRHTGHDFTQYKEGTLLRRLRRRLQVLHVGALADYLRQLENDVAEAEALVREFLVGVTQFFRDPAAFHSLSQQAVPRILQSKVADLPIRVWVVGCASGEEAYSIAILFREHIERLDAGSRRNVQIFATDLDSEMLAEARQGRYPLPIAEHVTPERLERFFVREAGSYQVSKELREMCLFSQHGLTRDPPFSQLDLISCRNVIIYLDAALQRKLVPLFHYALRPGGFLFLGPSEGLAGGAELFETVVKRDRIFRRRETITRPVVQFPLAAWTPPRSTAAPVPTPPRAQTAREMLATSFERLVLEEYSWPALVVDERGEIVLVAGPAARYLHLPAGALASNLLEAVRGQLRIEVRAALHAAAQGGRRVVRDRVPVDVEDVVRYVRLVVRPMPFGEPASTLFLVVLQEQGPAGDTIDEAGSSEQAGPSDDPAFQQLETELRLTRAELRSTVEALESANEELKSSNEELISTNEELQSANEELQTSKEELQSLNEELETVNAELRQKVDELGTANSDLQNLFASTDIATIFLDRQSKIVRFTPAATALFHLRESDVGRPIDELAPRFVGKDLAADCREVLRTLVTVERPVRVAQEPAWFILRVAPYRTVGNVIAGVVVTFVDVSALKRADERLRASEERLRVAQEVARVGTFELDVVTGVNTWTPELEAMYGLRPGGFPGTQAAWESLVHADDRLQAVRLVEEAFATGAPTEGEWRVIWPDGSIHWLTGRWQVFRDDTGRPLRMTGINFDITGRKATEEQLAYLASFPQKNPSPIVEADIEGRVTYANPAALREFPDISERGSSHPWLAGWESVAQSVGHGGGVTRREMSVGDRTFQQVLVYTPEKGVVRVYGVEITERRRAQEALERSRHGLSQLAAASLSVMARTDLADMLQAVAEAALALVGGRMATCGHGLVSGQLVVGGSARVPGAPVCPPGEMFALNRGGVHMDLVEANATVRLTDAQLREHPRWWGLPEAHVPTRGLLGARMVSRTGEPSGMILVTDKEQGDFTDEDESLLAQLATVASLALQHVEARISLEEGDRRKNDFLAMLSHELRNPLAPIRSSVYVLNHTAPGSSHALRAQSIIDRQVGHLTRLVDELLDVTRISRGKIQLQTELLDLAEVTRRAVEDYRPAFTAGDLELQVTIPEAAVWMNGDRTRVSQVIGNLLQNAQKFTHAGGTVSVSVEDNPHLRQAVVRVRDTGAGIAPETLPRIFEPFMQADTTLDRSQGGLGLGLALVKGLVEMHRGAVSVASSGLGQGAEFTLRFPIQAAPAAGREEPVAGTRRGRRGRRVLVIEDSIDGAESLRTLFELGGHAVEVAHSGFEGIEKARAFHPDLVLCDIGLPGMDGYAVARQMRDDPDLQSVVLVALTGYAAPEDVAKSRAAGFDHHLAKPPSIPRLQQILSGD